MLTTCPLKKIASQSRQENTMSNYDSHPPWKRKIERKKKFFCNAIHTSSKETHSKMLTNIIWVQSSSSEYIGLSAFNFDIINSNFG